MSLQGLGGLWDEEAPRLVLTLPLEDATDVVDAGDVTLVDMDADVLMSLFCKLDACLESDPQSANKPR